MHVRIKNLRAGEHSTEAESSTQSRATQCPWPILGQEGRGGHATDAGEAFAASASVSAQCTGVQVH